MYIFAIFSKIMADKKLDIKPTKTPIKKEPSRLAKERELGRPRPIQTAGPRPTPIETATGVFQPPPRPDSFNEVVNNNAIDYGINVDFEKDRKLDELCQKNPNLPFCIERECKKNPFGEKCRPELTSGDGAGTFNTATGVSTLETSQENINYCIKNPNDPSCQSLYNEELIDTLDGGVDNIYATSLELPSDCLTNPSKVDLNSCEGTHPRDIYNVMDKAEVNPPMQPQAPLQDQVGVSNLTTNPITETVSQPRPTLSMYKTDNDCKSMLNPNDRINNRPKITPKRNFGGDLNPITKKSSGNFFRARNPMGDGLDIYNKSFQNPLEYL